MALSPTLVLGARGRRWEAEAASSSKLELGSSSPTWETRPAARRRRRPVVEFSRRRNGAVDKFCGSGRRGASERGSAAPLHLVAILLQRNAPVSPNFLRCCNSICHMFHMCKRHVAKVSYKRCKNRSRCCNVVYVLLNIASDSSCCCNFIARFRMFHST
jgi:hypothetical protein